MNLLDDNSFCVLVWFDQPTLKIIYFKVLQLRKSEPDPTKKVKEQLISLFNGSEKIESANKFEKFEDTAAIISRTKKANIIFIAYQ